MWPSALPVNKAKRFQLPADSGTGAVKVKDSMSAITFNGKPLGDVLAAEASNEMYEALSDAAPRISRRSGGSKHKSFTNGISRNLDMPEPEPDFTRWVIIKGQQYLYEAKRPFGRSAFGIKAEVLGAQFYDPDSDKVQCLECGGWFEDYGLHRRGRTAHPSAKEYRIRHGLAPLTALCGLRFSQRRAQEVRDNKPSVKSSDVAAKKSGATVNAGRIRRPRSIEQLNKSGHCPVQIPDRLRLLAEEKGRVPTWDEVETAGLRIKTIEYVHGSYREAITVAGLKPRARGQKLTEMSRSEMLQRLISWYKVRGRWPKTREINNANLLPDRTSYIRRFGSWANAIAKAESRLIQAA